MLEVRLLGKFEVRVDGQPVEMPLRAAQALLAYLLLNAGIEPRREQVAGLLWPDMTDAKAKDNLRHTLWVIRKALGNRDYFLTDDFSASFNTALDYWLDVALLERRTTGEESADDLIAMVSAYGGGLLPGFYDDWIVLERERLQAVFERKMALLLDKLVEVQRWPDVLDWGERWIALGHVPEPAYRALMAAHAGRGDMASVATMYQRCVEALQTELGVEPAAQTRALYERLQRDATRVTDITPEIKVPRHNLPTPLTSFIGREVDVAQVRDYLRSPDKRLITLVGPPGIGKTRLSESVAREALADFPDGVFFVALAPLDHPDFIAPAIVQTLGFVETHHQSALGRLTDGIGDKRLLLVLDNVEHLIEGTAPLVADLLSACPYLKILTTSREALRVSGEWLYTVPMLDIPATTQVLSMDMEAIAQYAAVQLFAERARAVRFDFALNAGNIQTVATICARLDGLPLAIELIAARMRLMSPQALLERINSRFILSADGMRAASARQKTLNDAIAWSYNLLSAEEQKLFAYLSVLSGGFTLEAAEAIFARTVKEKSVPDLVASLLDKSLLQRVPDREARDEPRYTMLVIIQEFGRNRLREMGEETVVRNWHLAYFLALAEKGDAEIRGPNQIEWLHRLGVMRDNFRAALQWAIETGQTEAALQMARKLHWFFSVRGDHSEGRQWLWRVLAMPDAPLDPEAYAEALTQIALHTWIQIGHKQARPFVEQALAVARAHSDKRNTAKALAVLGLVLTHERHFSAAQSTLEESKALFREVRDEWGYAHAVMCLALGPYMQDDWPTALALHEEALVLFRELGDRYFQGVAHRFIGNLQVKRGDLTHGAAALRAALILAQDLNSKWEIYAVTWSFAEAAQRAGSPARAVQMYWAAKNIAETIGAWWQEDKAEFENNLAICRAALDESAFAAANEEGRALTLEQAIELALQEVD